MALLNYTTTIDVGKTTGEILVMLAKAGAASIKTDYEEGQAVAIEFLINTSYGRRAYRLPVNIDAIYKTIQQQYKSGKIPPRYVNREQAARIGWRIVKDWLAAELAIVETQMVSLDQVMFPYLLDNSNRPIYQVWVEEHLALPEGKEATT